jgi:hypothetical protein
MTWRVQFTEINECGQTDVFLSGLTSEGFTKSNVSCSILVVFFFSLE